MIVRNVIAAGLLWAATALPALAADPGLAALMAEDAPGAADSELTGRYEGAFIVGQTVRAFDELTLPDGPATGEDYAKDKAFTSTIAAQGKVTRTLYISPENRSSLEVLGNYADALKAKGFTEVYSCAREACGPSFKVLKYAWDNPATHVISEGSEQRRASLAKAMFDRVIDQRYILLKQGEPGAESYAAVFAAVHRGGTFGNVSDALQSRVGVMVEIVEAKAREDKMVTLSADEIGSALTADGRVVLYGIFFDFDKATIKPESAPQLEEMVRFLDQNPEIKVYVVGHTDSKGALDYNLKLSDQRAQAVMKALAKAGIGPKRLTAKGLGPLAPLASNRSDEGRAKNRRVELVEQ